MCGEGSIVRGVGERCRDIVSDPLYRTSAWEQVRLFVLARDNFLCQICLREHRLSPADTVHHG